MAGILNRLLALEEREKSRVLVMFLLYLVVVAAGFVVGRTVSSTLFLNRLAPEWLPFAYASAAAGVCVVSLLYAAVASRLPRIRFFQLTLGLFALLLLGFRALVEVAPSSLVVVGSLYVLVDAFSVLAVTQFWTLACELFTSREARRVFSLVGAGSTVGMLTLGAFTHWTVGLLGTENLLVVMSLLLAAGVALLAAVRRIQARQAAADSVGGLNRWQGTERPEQVRGGLAADLVRLFKSRNLAVVACITILMAGVITIIDFQWKVSARDAFSGDEAGLASYFGLFNLVVGFLSLLVQLFVTGRVLGDLGVLPALMMLPLSLLGTSAGVLLASATAITLASGTAAAGANSLLRFTVQTTSVQLLFRPVPAQFRPRAEALVEGVLKPLTTVATGLLIAATAAWLCPRDLSWVAVGLITVWILLNFSARKHYVEALGERIRSRRLDLEGSHIPLDDATVSAVRKAMAGADESAVIGALDLVRALPERDWCHEVAVLLDSPSPQVRHLALAYIEEKGGPHHLAPRSRLQDKDPLMRAAAARAVGAILRHECASSLAPVLRDPDIAVRAAAAATIVRHCDQEDREQGLKFLHALATAPEPGRRAAAARAIATTDGLMDAAVTLALLKDPDPLVADAAAASVSPNRASDAVVDALVALLASPRTFRSASSVLVRLSDRAVPFVAAALRDRNRSFALRMRLPRLLSDIGSPAAMAVVESSLDAPDPPLRSSLAQQAASLRRRKILPSLGHDAVHALVRKEAEAYFQAAVHKAECRLDKGSLLLDALDSVQLTSSRTILHLLYLAHPDDRFPLVAQGISSANAAVRSDALELLDYTLTGDDRNMVMAIFDAKDAQAQADAAARFLPRAAPLPLPERLVEMVQGPDRWLAACALHEAADRGVSELVPHALRIAREGTPFLAQTALGVLRKLGRQDEFEKLVLECAGSARPLVAETAAAALRGGKMATIVERVLFLKSVDLFSQIPGNVLSRIAEIAREERVPEGTVLLRQGDAGSGLYVVMQGRLSIKVDGVEVATLADKQFFGEMSLFDAEPVSGTVTSTTEVDLLRIEPHDFSDLMTERVEVAHGLIAVLIRRLRSAGQLTSVKLRSKS